MKTKLLLLSLLFAGASYCQEIALNEMAAGFNGPVEITHAGDSRLFVVQQGGLIRILNADGSVNPTPFLNIASLISTGGERGLLGLAFHPDYENNAYFYVNYTNIAGNTVIARYTTTDANSNVADPASAQILITINQPAANHNGGCLRFGPDGYLYISMGDGGGAGDPNGNGQNKNTLLGKLLRIDVDNGDTYTSPDDNPFVGIDGADEIWAYGLRNAWKFSFDVPNDGSDSTLWIADVGQGAIEEINKVASNVAGVNYGWRCFEGTETFNNENCSLVEMYTPPVAQYTHADTEGCSITGGYVYRGSTYPNLQGKYLFADLCTNKIGIVNADNQDNPGINFTQAFAGNSFTTFGEDMNGELYIAGSQSGKVYKITDTSLSIKTVASSSFSIYPNPAHDAVTIANGTKGVFAVTAQVYDVSGKLLLNKKLNNTVTNILAIDNLSSGLYMVNITDSKGTVNSHKLAVK